MRSSIADAIDAALVGRKQAEIAMELGWPESKVSERLAALRKDDGVLLDALNLKAVPKRLECFDPDKLTLFIETFKVASQALNINHLKSEL